jgi:hypothetical protein
MIIHTKYNIHIHKRIVHVSNPYDYLQVIWYFLHVVMHLREIGITISSPILVWFFKIASLPN